MYRVRRGGGGEAVSICLLMSGEILYQWQVLNFQQQKNNLNNFL